MTVWEFGHSVDGFRAMTLAEPYQDWDYWRSLSSRVSLRDNWTEPKLRFLKPRESGFADEQADWSIDTDAPWMPGLALGLSRRAADRLGEVLLCYGEFLPVDCDEGEFVIYHCMNQLDGALDGDRSEGSRSRDGRLLSLKKPAFRPAVVRGQDVFTVPAPNPYTLFVSDRFVQLANASGLVGMNFVPVWGEAAAGKSLADAPTERTKRRAMTFGPLPQKAAKMIPQAIAAAQRAVSVDLACTPMAETVQKVQSTIDENDKHAMADASLLAAALGTLWGEVICREFGWEWAWVREGDIESAGIVAPTRSHVVFPQPYFYNLLARRGRGPTSLELYNMIKSGTLPMAEPNSCLVLA